MHPKNFTDQENIIASELTKLGIRYEQQVVFGKYTADFFLPGEKIILEADGVYGHYKKADEKRDSELEKFGVSVFHIKESNRKDIAFALKKELCQE